MTNPDGGPTPDSLRQLAEWFDGPRSPAVIVKIRQMAARRDLGWTAGYLLRRIAEAMEESRSAAQAGGESG